MNPVTLLPYPPFDPLDGSISSLVAWYDGIDSSVLLDGVGGAEVAVGDDIPYWAAKGATSAYDLNDIASGGGGTGLRRDANGVFCDTGRLLRSTGAWTALTQPFEVVCVARATSVTDAASVRALFRSTGVGTTCSAQASVNGNIWLNGAGGAKDTGANTDALITCFSFLFDDAATQVWIDGTSSVVSATPGTDGLANIALGGYQDGLAPWLGKLFDVLLYDKALTNGERTTIRDWALTRHMLRWPETFYWLGATTDPTVSTNWSPSSGGTAMAVGANTPGRNVPVTFDGGAVANCTFSAAESAWGDLNLLVGYTGTVDLATFDLAMYDGADITLAGGVGSVFDAGTATKISLVNGNFDNSLQTTYTRGTSELSMSGVGTLTGTNTNELNDLTFEVGCTITIDPATSNRIVVRGTCTIDGSVVCNDILAVTSIGQFVINSTAVISGSNYIYLTNTTGGGGITTLQSGASIGVPVRIYAGDGTVVLAAGTYGDIIIAGIGAVSTTWVPGVGEYILTGDLSFSNSGTGTLLLDNSTNDPDFTIQGDVTWVNSGGGTNTWTAGIGTLTASLAANQAWDFGGTAMVEKLVINKSAGVLSLPDSVTFASIDHQAGGLNLTDNNTVTTTGDWDMAAGTTIVGLKPATAAVGGDLAWTGTSVASRLVVAGSGAGDDFILNVTGTGVFVNVEVSRTDASGSTVNIDATVGCLDGLNNAGIDFV